MRLLVILSVWTTLTIVEAKYELTPFYVYRGPPAPLSHDGRVIDTAEVAHAKAVHLAAHAEARAKLRESRKEYTVTTTVAPPVTKSFAPLGEDGRVVDTPEVAQAKAAHLEAHARAAARTASPNYRFDVYNGRRNLIYVAPVRVAYTHLAPAVGYQGPAAPLGPDGRVIDTPEVARAREQHMKAHERAAALAVDDDSADDYYEKTDHWVDGWGKGYF